MLNLQKRHQALHQMVRVGVRTQWLDRDHGMPAGDIGLAEFGKPGKAVVPDTLVNPINLNRTPYTRTRGAGLAWRALPRVLPVAPAVRICRSALGGQPN